MKEMVTSWIILASIIALYIVNGYIVKKETTSVCDNIELAIKAVEDEKVYEAEKIISSINKNWKKTSKKIIYIFPHSQIEEIGRIMLLAKQHIAERDLNDAVLRLKEVDYLVKLLKRREKITLDNIF